MRNGKFYNFSLKSYDCLKDFSSCINVVLEKKPMGNEDILR